ncbi:MAG: esterase-like activity of phytase family protein [Leptolyngbya sp. SIO1D8]|nr:esterase-like activity of phytase family protein [Leptolyngbya sp. SIO1D8]
MIVLSGCALPQVSAEDRLFLNVNLELLDVATLPQQLFFEETPVGGLSALAYDANRGVFYALSDDRGRLASPRFYTLDIATDTTVLDAPTIRSVQVTDVTFLRDAEGNLYASDRLDPEGMALSPRQSLFISSEGVTVTNSPPALNEYDLQSGTLKTEFRLPARYLPTEGLDDSGTPQGIRDNQGLEALTLNPTSSTGAFEPFRVFTATESALAQDFDEDPANPLTNRFLHYLIDPNQSTLISEHAYPLSLEPMGAVSNGLAELLTLDQGGHFLALERVYGIRGFEIKLFQLATGGATDISTLDQLPPLDSIIPIRKQLVLDFATLDPPVEAIDNLEGMTFGAPLPGGAMSLWMISDNNFSEEQTTQIWLFRLTFA